MKVLLVDDDPNLRGVLTEILNVKRIEAIPVETGAAALSRIDEDDIDVALIDLKLEDISGLEVLRGIKERSADTECILLTGHASQDSAIQAINLGAYSYVQKPYDMDQLLVTIRRAGEKRAAKRALAASEDRFRSLYENATIGIYRTTPAGDILLANPALVKMIGYDSFEEWATNNLEKEGYYEPDYPREQFKKKIEQDGEVRGLESAWKCKDGSTIYVRESAKLVRDPHGEILYYEGSVEDVTGKKMAEEALRQAEEKYRSIFENAAEGIYQSTPEGRFITANPALSRMWGYESPEELIASITDIGRQVYSDPNRRAELRRVLEELGEVRQVESQIRKKDGSLMWVSENMRAVRNANGAFTYEGTFEDITERKQAEDAVNESEQRFSRLFAASPDALILIDPSDPTCDWPIMDCNEIACQMNGYTREELIGKSIDILNITRATPQERAAYMERIRLAGVLHQESFHCHRDGHIFPIEVSTSIITFKGRELILGIDRDISERKQAEERIAASESEFRALFASMTDMVIVYDTDGRYIKIAPTKLTSFYRPLDDMLGKTVHEILPKEQAEFIVARVRESIQSGKVVNAEYTLQVGSKEKWFSANVSRLSENTAVWVAHDITQRVQAEEVLAQERNLLRTLIDNLPDRIYIEDTQGRKILSNISDWQASGGKTMEDVIGKTDFETYPPELAENFWALEKTVIDSGISVVNHEEPGLDSKGNPVLVLSTKVPLRDGQGKIVGLVGIGRDITEQKRAEVALRESEERFRVIFEKANDAIHIENSDDKILAVNSRMCELMGYSREELLKMHVADLQAPERRQPGIVVKNELARHGSAIFEALNLHRDGRRIPVEISIGRIELPSGDLYVSVVRDITERKQMEEALAWEQDLLRTLLDNLPDHIYFKDRFSRFTRISKSLAEVFNLSDSAVALGKTDFDFFTEVHARPAFEAEQNIMATGQPVVHLEEKETWLDGRLTWVNTTKMPLQDQAGNIIGTFGISSDITERVQAEETLRKSAIHLARSQSIGMLGSWDWDIVENSLIWSDEVYRIWGVGKDFPLTFDNIAEMIHPDDRDLNSKMVQETFATRDENESEFRIICPNGGVKYIYQCLEVTRAPSGQPIKVFGIMQDITERKKAEEALQMSEEKYRTLVDEVNDGFYVTDSVGAFTFANPALARIYGFESPQAMVGRKFTDFIALGVHTEIGVSFSGAMQTGHTPEVINGQIVRPDGICAFIEIKPTSIFKNGQIAGSRGVVRDVTERVKADEAVQRSEQRYRALFEDTPIAIWEQDFSRLKEHLDSLRQQGITDFRLYFASHPQAVIECAGMIRIVSVNNAALHMYRAESKQALLEATHQEISPGELEHLGEDFIAIAEGRTGRSWEGTDSTLTGEPLEISLHWSVAPGHEDDYSKVIVTTLDITERKQADKALRKKEEQYRLLFENAPVGILSVTAEGQILEVNPAALEILGSPSAAATKAINILKFPALIQAGIAGDIQRCLDTVQTVANESPYVSNWGKNVYVHYSLRPVFDPNGQTSLVQIMLEDITERRQAEDEIRQHVAELEMLYQSGLALNQLLSPKEIGEKIIDLLEQKMDWHHTAIRLFNPQSETLELLAFSEPGLKDENERHKVKALLNNRITRPGEGLSGWVVQNSQIVRSSDVSNDPRYVETYPGLHSGLYVPVKSGERTIGVISIESERPNAFSEADERLVITLANQAAVAIENADLYQTAQQEIIERKRIETLLADERNQLAHRVEERTADINRVNSDLARALRVKDEFLASMSHELRTPLTGILGLSEALQVKTYGELNDKQQNILKMIEESGRHLLDLINDILDLSKIEAGKFELQFTACSLADICQASLQLIKGMAQQKHQHVHYSPPAKPIIVNADARRLKQMLVNLLGNAIKFTPENGELGLEVKANESGRNLKLIVWDKGIGIKLEDQNKLFKPFVQLDSGLAREYSGTGLGLSLARRLAELHNGTIEVESVFDEGSRLTITLPWSPQDTIPIPYTPRRGTGGLVFPPERSKAPLVMFADDNEMVLHMVADYLETKQYRVMKVRSGAELLEQAAEFHPDIMLVDIQMPGMDGLETIRCIRSHADPLIAAAPVIAVTALAMPGDREDCLRAGANDYMSKPVKLKQLVIAIQKLLENKQ